MSDTLSLEIDDKAPDFIVQGTVVIFQNKRFIIKKRNPKNYRLMDANGLEYNLARTAAGLKRAKVQDWEGERVDDYSLVMAQLERLNLKPGAVVEFKRLEDKRRWPGYYVIANVGSKNYRVHALGDEGSNAYVSVSPEYVQVAAGTWVPSTDGHVGTD